jgi:hypothetical protein
MDRAQALKTLRLDGSADGRTVESAYWMLVRRAQRRAETDTDARREIELLNEAYGALAPAGRHPHRPASARSPGEGGAPAILDAFAGWVATEARRTRVRWSGRNPEITVIGGAALALMATALAAGASVAATLALAALLFGAIWAPWRPAR